MDEQTSEASGQTADTPDGKSKRPVPATLMEFLEGDSPPSAYVGELGNGSIAIPNENAREYAVEAVTKNPALLPRVVALTRSALAKKDSRIKAAFGNFASNVIRGQDRELADWNTVGGLPPEAGLVKLADRVRTAKASKDKEALQQAEQLLALGMAVLSSRNDFDPLAALSQVYAQLLRNRDTSRRPAESVVREAISSASVKNLETFGAFNAVLSKTLDETRKELSRARDDLLIERDRIRALQAKVNEGAQQVEKIEAEKLELADRLNSAGTQLKGVQGGKDDELNTLRARFRQLLKAKLSPFVATAQEALELEPPVTKVAQDRLDRIKTEIEGELDWLNRFLG